MVALKPPNNVLHVQRRNHLGSNVPGSKRLRESDNTEVVQNP